jgi:hypothetical protein
LLSLLLLPRLSHVRTDAFQGVGADGGQAGDGHQHRLRLQIVDKRNADDPGHGF